MAFNNANVMAPVGAASAVDNDSDQIVQSVRVHRIIGLQEITKLPSVSSDESVEGTNRIEQP